MLIDRREILALGASLVALGTRGDGPETPASGDPEIVAILKKIHAQHAAPGLTAAVAVGNGPSRVGAVGIRKQGSPEPLGTGDQIHLGSCTKAMTATLIAGLVEEGKLAWDASLAGVFPDQAKAMHADFRGVTLTQMLTHRAGLPANGPWHALGKEKSTTEQRMALLELIVREKPVSRPGSTFLYSNVGYALAGLMAETVARASWESLMQGRLFDPLGMASAGFGPPGTPGKVDQPWGHAALFGFYRANQIDNPPSLGPAGRVHASMEDWLKFGKLHLDGALGRSKSLRPETFNSLHTPAEGESYTRGGWGIAERDAASGRCLTHAGSNTFWFAEILIMPRRDAVIVAASNAADDRAQQAAGKALEAMLAIVPGEPKPGG